MRVRFFLSIAIALYGFFFAAAVRGADEFRENTVELDLLSSPRCRTLIQRFSQYLGLRESNLEELFSPPVVFHRFVRLASDPAYMLTVYQPRRDEKSTGEPIRLIRWNETPASARPVWDRFVTIGSFTEWYPGSVNNAGTLHEVEISPDDHVLSLSLTYSFWVVTSPERKGEFCLETGCQGKTLPAERFTVGRLIRIDMASGNEMEPVPGDLYLRGGVIDRDRNFLVGVAKNLDRLAGWRISEEEPFPRSPLWTIDLKASIGDRSAQIEGIRVNEEIVYVKTKERKSFSLLRPSKVYQFNALNGRLIQ